MHLSIYLSIHPSIYLPGYGSKFGTPIIRWLILNIRMLKSMVAYTHTPKSLQCLRLTAIPNQNARHDPCPGTDLAKPLSPLETLALTSLDQTIMVLFVFDRIPSERRFPTGLFSWALLTPTNKNAKQALFLVCILQEWVLIKEKNEVQNEVRKKPRIYTHGLWPASRKPALPWITGSETMTICRIPAAHRHGSVEMIFPALCRSTRKQQQQQPSNQQPQQQQDPSSCRTQQQPSQTQWERN